MTWRKEGATPVGFNPVQLAVLPVGTHTITLEVTDSNGGKGVDTVVITVVAPEILADAGQDQTVTDTDDDGSELVILDGSSSSSRTGMITAYIWTEGAPLLGGGEALPVLLPVGQHTITLTVVDILGATDSDTVVVTVSPGGPPAPGDCDSDGDVDLDDFVIFKQNFGRDDAAWADGDFTGEGTVDLDDFVLLKQNFGQ